MSIKDNYDLDSPSPSSDSDGDGGWNTPKIKTILYVVLGISLLGAVLYQIRPLLHFWIMAVYRRIGFLITLGAYTTVFVLIDYVLKTYISAYNALTKGVRQVIAGPPFSNTSRELAVIGKFILIALILIVPVALGTGMYAADYQGSVAIENSEQSEQLPEMSAENPSILPSDVTKRLADNSLATPMYQASGGDTIMHEGNVTSAYALEPEGPRNRLLEKQSGVVYVNKESMGADPTVERFNMTYGIGPWVTNSLSWRLHTTGDYLVDYRNKRAFTHNGSGYVQRPVTAPELKLRLTPLPALIQPDVWQGTALVHQDGTTRHLTPSEARNESALEGQPLRPRFLVREQISGTQYRNGIANTLPIGSHSGQIELAEVPHHGDKQPFYYQDSTRGQGVYVTAVEPFGQTTSGLNEIWVADSRAEGYEVVEPDEGTYTGARVATDYVTELLSNQDWDQLEVAEPIPTAIDGTLYWQVRVVPTDSANMAFVVHVNAEDSSEGFATRNMDVVKSFLNGEIDPSEVDRADEVTYDASSGGTEVIVQKVNTDSGEVIDELEIGENEELVIEKNSDEGESENGE